MTPGEHEIPLVGSTSGILRGQLLPNRQIAAVVFECRCPILRFPFRRSHNAECIRELGKVPGVVSVADLGTGDFQVFDNGKATSVASATFQSAADHPPALVIVLDLFNADLSERNLAPGPGGCIDPETAISEVCLRCAAPRLDKY